MTKFYKLRYEPIHEKRVEVTHVDCTFPLSGNDEYKETVSYRAGTRISIVEYKINDRYEKAYEAYLQMQESLNALRNTNVGAYDIEVLAPTSVEVELVCENPYSYLNSMEVEDNIEFDGDYLEVWVKIHQGIRGMYVVEASKSCQVSIPWQGKFYKDVDFRRPIEASAEYMADAEELLREILPDGWDDRYSKL